MRKPLSWALAVSLLLAIPAFAQIANTSPTAEAKAPETRPAPFMGRDPATQPAPLAQQVVKTIYLTYANEPTRLQDVVNGLRTILEFQRVQPIPSQRAVVIRGNPEQVAAAEKMIHDIDRPNPAPVTVPYRVDFTVRQFENGKPASAKTYSIIVQRSGSRDEAVKYTLRAGSRVPIATGSFRPGSDGGLVNTQFNYQDIGVNIDCRLWGNDDALMLWATAEVSSVSSAQMVGGINEPTIRRINTDLTSPIGSKPTTIASFDEVDAPRRMDIEVVATKLR